MLTKSLLLTQLGSKKAKLSQFSHNKDREEETKDHLIAIQDQEANLEMEVAHSISLITTIRETKSFRIRGLIIIMVQVMERLFQWEEAKILRNSEEEEIEITSLNLHKVGL